jgi:ketosteroid isomerase-like protein
VTRLALTANEDDPEALGVDECRAYGDGMADPCAAIRSFLDAYGVGDLDAMRAALADGFVGYVTNAASQAERVEGREAYLARLPVLATADATASMTQTVRVAPDQALTMVEVHAQRSGRKLHNFGAFLSRHDGDGRITELWMVDAKPAYSDEFWS